MHFHHSYTSYIIQGLIENSFEIVTKLRGQFLDTQHCLIFLDVVLLFTNVPLELAIGSIEKRWHFISETTDIPYTELIAGVRLVLNSSSFKFNDKNYRQIFGTPMGSPLSPVLADIVLQDIEERTISGYRFCFLSILDMSITFCSQPFHHFIQLYWIFLTFSIRDCNSLPKLATTTSIFLMFRLRRVMEL